MDQNEIASLYRQTSARGSNPVGLVVKLYDAILEDFRRAGEAIRAEDIERRTSAFNHALLIIAELESVLDHDRGGSVAQQLRGFYSVTRAMIVEANIQSSLAKTEKLAELFVPLKQAWQVVEHDVARGKVDLSGMNVSPDSPFASLLTSTRRLVPELDTDEEGAPSQWKA
jgi:flagellar biosynthetic protein FliS